MWVYLHVTCAYRGAQLINAKRRKKDESQVVQAPVLSPDEVCSNIEGLVCCHGGVLKC